MLPYFSHTEILNYLPGELSLKEVLNATLYCFPFPFKSILIVQNTAISAFFNYLLADFLFSLTF